MAIESCFQARPSGLAGVGWPQGQTVPGNSGPSLPWRWETLTPASPARAVALRSGGAGWAAAQHLEPPWLEPPGPGCPRVSAGPCGSQDADPRRGGAGRARCPSPGRPAAVEQAGAGGRSLSESRAKLGLCAKLGAPAGLQSLCGSAQRGNRRLPGGAGLRTSAPGARRRSDGTDGGCGSGTGETPRGARSPTLALLQGAESGSGGPPPRNGRHLLQTRGTRCSQGRTRSPVRWPLCLYRLLAPHACTAPNLLPRDGCASGGYKLPCLPPSGAPHLRLTPTPPRPLPFTLTRVACGQSLDSQVSCVLTRWMAWGPGFHGLSLPSG